MTNPLPQTSSKASNFYLSERIYPVSQQPETVWQEIVRAAHVLLRIIIPLLVALFVLGALALTAIGGPHWIDLFLE